MARRPNALELRLAALEALIRRPLTPTDEPILGAALERGTSLEAAAAGKAVAQHRLAWTPAVLAALDRFYAPDSDPQCHAKVALAGALIAGEHPDAGPLLRAVAHHQPEGSWGKPTDSAVRLRVLALDGLLRLGHPDLYRIIADRLADGSPEVRSAAARVAGEIGGERAELLLRLRLLLVDDDDDATADAAGALLATEGDRGLPLVLDLFRRAAEPSRRSALALALGTSRLAAALPPLASAFARSVDPQDRRILITAISLHRSEAAAERLLAILDDDDPGVRLAAAGELHLYRDRPAVVSDARRIADSRGDARLNKALDLAFS